MKTKKFILSQISIEDLSMTLSESLRKILLDYLKKEPEKNTELVTRSEVSKILGISLTTLNDYTKRGMIPAYRLGKNVRYKKTEVLASLELIKSTKYKRG